MSADTQTAMQSALKGKNTTLRRIEPDFTKESMLAALHASNEMRYDSDGSYSFNLMSARPNSLTFSGEQLVNTIANYTTSSAS